MLILSGCSSPHRLPSYAPAAMRRKGAFNGAGRGWCGSVHSRINERRISIGSAPIALGQARFNDVDRRSPPLYLAINDCGSFEALGELLCVKSALARSIISSERICCSLERTDSITPCVRSCHKRGRLIPLSDYPITGYSSKSELLLYRNRDCGLSAIIC